MKAVAESVGIGGLAITVSAPAQSAAEPLPRAAGPHDAGCPAAFTRATSYRPPGEVPNPPGNGTTPRHPRKALRVRTESGQGAGLFRSSVAWGREDSAVPDQLTGLTGPTIRVQAKTPRMLISAATTNALV